MKSRLNQKKYIENKVMRLETKKGDWKHEQ